MSVHVHWDDPDEPGGNVAHIAEHGLTPREVEDVLLDDTIPEHVSRAAVQVRVHVHRPVHHRRVRGR